MIVEDEVCIFISARHDIGPQFPHEKNLIWIVGSCSWNMMLLALYLLMGIILPSLAGRAFFIHSVRLRMKSKKNSPSGTLIALSAIFTKILKPWPDNRSSLSTTVFTRSLALVEESTKNACGGFENFSYHGPSKHFLPPQWHQGSKSCDSFLSSCVE